MKSAKKSLAAVIMAIVMIGNLGAPAIAANNTAAGNAIAAEDAFHSSLTAPLNFDGSKPDSTEVKIVSPLSPAFSEQGAAVPSKVTTVLTDGAQGTLNLITADRYFYTNNYGSPTEAAMFIAELENLYAGATGSETYSVRLGTDSSVITSHTSSVFLSVQRSGDNGYVSGDISSIVTSDAASLYIAVDDGEGNTAYYTSAPVSAAFIHDDTVAVEQGKYVHSGNLSFSLSLSLPGNLTLTGNSVIELLDGGSNVVAKNLDGMSYSSIYQNTRQEHRYDGVFGAYISQSCYYAYNNLSTQLFFAQKLAAGQYGVRLTNGMESWTYQDIITVLDTPVVSNFYAASGNGFAPPVYGNNTVYVCVSADGAALNDFTVSVLAGDGSTIGTSSSARYYQSQLYYKVTLNSGTFVSTEDYSIKLTYNGTGDITFAPGEDSQLSPEGDFSIYDVLFNGEKNKADFTLRAVNPPAGVTTLYLFGSAAGSDINAVPLAIADVTASGTMTVKFTDGNSDEPLTLDNGSYSIRVKHTVNLGGGFSYQYWNHVANFYVSVYGQGSPAGDLNYLSIGKAFVLTGDTDLPFDIFLSKAAYGLTSGTTYDVSLVNGAGDTVGSLASALSVSDGLFSNSQNGPIIDGARLSGTVSIEPNVLSEGAYYIKITAVTGTVSINAAVGIRCLDSAKTYAISSYPQLMSTGIDGYIYSPLLSTFDASKFAYVLKGLNGNVLISETPAVTPVSDYQWDLNTAFSAPLAPGYYSLELTYDGKTIYDFYNPEVPLFSGYSLYKFVAAETTMKTSYINQAGEIYGILVDDSAAVNLSVTAAIYDGSDITNFVPVKTLSMTKNPSNGLFEFTDLSGIETGKEYDVAFIDNNGICFGFLSDDLLGYVTTTNVSVESVSLNKDSIELSIGDTYTLTKTIQPSNASNKNVAWSSDKTGIATVGSTGIVTAVAKGTATITVTTEDGGKTSTCQVTVVDTISVKGVTLDKSVLTLNAGDTCTLHAAVTPVGATNKTVSWSSGNTDVATVDAITGQITAVSAGSTVITATTADGGKTAACTLTVGIPVSGLLTCGGTAASGLWVDLYREDGSVAASVCTDQDGVFSFQMIPVGSYTLKAYSPDSGYLNLSATVGVIPGVTGKWIDPLAFESRYDQTSVLTVSISKTGAINGTVWVCGADNGYYSSQPVTGTDSASVTFENLPYSGSTQYNVEIYDKSSGYYNSKAILIETGNASASFIIPQRYSITGTVLNVDSMAVPNVRVVSTGVNGTFYGYTNANGEYTITGLPSGDYDVSLSQWDGYSSGTVNVTVDSNIIDCNLTATEGMTLRGKVHKAGDITNVPYKAVVTLTDGIGDYVAGGYATGDGGFVFSKAIKTPGYYTLTINSMLNSDYTSVQYISAPLILTVTADHIAAGIMTQNIAYTEPADMTGALTGDGNVILSDISVVHDSSAVNLIVKYKNNSLVSVDQADFSVALPAGVTSMIPGSETFTVLNLAAGAAGKQTIALNIGALQASFFSIPVTVTYGGQPYSFGAASLEYANISLSGQEAAKPNESFKVYGEATANSAVVIKNAETGEVLGTAITSGRWYSCTITLSTVGTYKLVAEAAVAGVTALSDILTVDVRADQIAVAGVTANGSALKLNKRIGVYTFSTYADMNLAGFDIPIAVAFTNGDPITSATFHFSGNDYTAEKNGGNWEADLIGWTGAGLKTITITVETGDGRTLDFILCEVTVLIDPSGIITDSETGKAIQGAAVYLDVYIDGAWQLYDAELYGQQNPLTTDAAGRYGWMTPNGTYRVRAYKIGYAAYDSLLDSNFSSGGDSTIIVPPPRDDVNFAMTPSVPVTSVALNKSVLSLTVGSSRFLQAMASPLGAMNASDAAWTSSDLNVATVTNGIVTAVGVGTATIRASVGDDWAECAVDVVQTGLSVTINANGTEMTIDTDNAEPCSAVAVAYDATGKMLSAGVTSIVRHQNTAEISINTASLPAGYVIKLFLLDSGNKPLRGYYTYS
jgi:uncharacterized protein YjdB